MAKKPATPKPLTPLTFQQVMGQILKDVEKPEDASALNRENVHKNWASLSDEGKHAVCRTCSSYFPKGGDTYDCLSGHGFHMKKACPSYTPAIFRLCEDWDYTVRQVYLIKELERICRLAAGEDDDDDL